MSSKTQIKVIVTLDGSEKVLFSKSVEGYHPELLDKLIPDALAVSATSIPGQSFESLKELNPELSIYLSLDEDSERPSFNLSSATLGVLSKAGASFDFDPY